MEHKLCWEPILWQKAKPRFWDQNLDSLVVDVEFTKSHTESLPSGSQVVPIPLPDSSPAWEIPWWPHLSCWFHHVWTFSSLSTPAPHPSIVGCIPFTGNEVEHPLGWGLDPERLWRHCLPLTTLQSSQHHHFPVSWTPSLCFAITGIDYRRGRRNHSWFFSNF